MNAATPDRSGLLKWYPSRWRERYGEEMAAVMEDFLDGRPPSRRFRASIAWAGLRERGHETGLFGDSGPAGARLRAACLLVLCAWSAFVVAGASFAKIAENFDLAVPAHARALAADSWYTVSLGAVVAGTFVLVGAAMAMPAFVRFLRSGGWPSVRGHVVRAASSSIVAVAAASGLVALAHTLTPAERNGALLYHPVVWYYLVAFIATALVVGVSLALWTAAAVATASRIVLPEGVVSAEAVLALAVAGGMVLMTAATALWWGAIGSSAAWYLQGVRPGSPASAVSTNLAATMALMVLACAVASYGVVRILRSWSELRLA